MRIGKVHVYRTAQTSVEELEVDTEVVRIGGLPAQVGVADTVARQIGRVGGAAAVAPDVLDAIGRIKPVERHVARNGVVTVGAVGEADFQHVDPRSVVLDEILLAEMPCDGSRGEEGPLVVFGEGRERVGAARHRQQVFAVEAVIHTEHARNHVLFPVFRTDGDLVLGAVHPVEARIVVHEALAALRSLRILGLLHGEESREVDVVFVESPVEFQHVLPRPVRRVVVFQFGTAVPVAFVQAVHERKDIDRPAVLHDIADHTAVAAHGREKRVLSGLAVEPVEVPLRRGINVFAGAYQRQRRNRAVRRPFVTHQLGQAFRIERLDVVVADQPYRTVAVDHDRTDIPVQYRFETPGTVVEAQQSVVGSDVQPAAVVCDHLSVIPVGTRREARDQIVHPNERTAVIHEQRIVSAEPDSSHAVFGDAVDTPVIGGFRHGVKAVIQVIQRSVEGGGKLTMRPR